MHFSHTRHKPSKYHSSIIIMKSNKCGAPADKSGIATTPKRFSKRVKSVSTPSTPTSERTSEKCVVPFGKTPADPLFVEIMDVNFNEDGLFILDFIDVKVAKLYDEVQVLFSIEIPMLMCLG